MITQEDYTLAGGVRIPKLGLGTWMIDDDKVAAVVRSAIQAGYRLIDTAQAYGNERGVGEGIRTSGRKREELFVASKLAAEIKDYDAAVKAIDGTLLKMQLDYLDQMIIHAPQPWAEFRTDANYDEGNLEAWRALEDAHRAGKVRVIGVSNFLKHDVENILSHATVRPMVCQILAHVSNTPLEFIEWLKEHNMLVEAYSPIAHGEILKNEQVALMASNYGVSAPQLCLRYLLQQGLLPLPKATSADHIRQNAQLDFTISDEDMGTLKHIRRIDNYGDYSFFPVFGGKKSADGKYKPGKPHTL